MKAIKVVWADQKNIYVVRKGDTSNDKISNGDPLIQTYTFSREQYNLARTSKGFGMKKFFALDGSNCLDCPFSGNQGAGGCYTHKFEQYIGFLSMLRSIAPSELTRLTILKERQILSLCFNTYVRFGTYGEPSLIPVKLVREMAAVSSAWTGYTHQYSKPFAAPYKDFFMASVHSANEAQEAREKIGYRSFIVTDKQSGGAVPCPASAEMGYKSNCAKCGLCSGITGKGKKDVEIIEH